jgi:beta-glucanase (GH16 family)
LAGTVSVDFTKGISTSVFKVVSGTSPAHEDKKGARFTILSDDHAPTLTSHKYLFFGKIEVVMQAAPGAGIVSSIVLQSDDLDEIDWEWIGNDPDRVQSNYYSKGNTTTFDRGQ